MSKRPTRHVGLFPADRDDLLRKAHALWRATCATMAYMKTPSDDYKAAQTLAFGPADFAKRISGGQAVLRRRPGVHARHGAAIVVQDGGRL